MGKEITFNRLKFIQLMILDSKEWIENEWENLDGEKNYAGMIENMRSHVNYQYGAQVDQSKYLDDDANVPTKDVLSGNNDQNPYKVSSLGLHKVAIYEAAKEKLNSRPWWRYLLHPFTSYKESKCLSNLKKEITSDLYGMNDKALNEIEGYLDRYDKDPQTENTKKGILEYQNNFSIGENGEGYITLDNDLSDEFELPYTELLDTESQYTYLSDSTSNIDVNESFNLEDDDLKIDTNKATIDLQSKLSKEDGISNDNLKKPSNEPVDKVEEYMKTHDPLVNDF